MALGYRESVNLAQIKTFVEMDSHEEKVYQAVRQTQEKEAKQKMREKAKELQRQRMESQKKGFPSRGGYSSNISSEGFGSTGGISNSNPISPVSIGESSKPSPSVSSKVPAKKGMKLGGKSRDVDSFVDQLKSEGEKVSNLTHIPTTSSSVSAARSKPDVPMDE